MPNLVRESARSLIGLKKMDKFGDEYISDYFRKKYDKHALHHLMGRLMSLAKFITTIQQ